MQNTTMLRPNSSKIATTTDGQFIALLHAFRHSGGLARGQEVFTMYTACQGADAAKLAHWIFDRSVISFDWESKIWLPLFQFNLVTMAPQPGLHPILAVLNPIFDAWEMAHWFAQPSHWLAECTPADMLSVDAMAVLDAATRTAVSQSACSDSQTGFRKYG